MNLRRTADFPPATHEENEVLCGRIQRGDLDAENELVERNLAFVIKLLNEEFSWLDEDLRENCVMVGCSALLVAARRFDPKLGNHYSTYASWWIKQAMRREVGNFSRTIRTPIHLGQQQAQVKKKTFALQGRLGRKPTIEEICEETGFDKEHILRIYAIPWTIDLDKPLSEDSPENTVAGTVPDQTTPRADQLAMIRDEYHANVARLLNMIRFARVVSSSETAERNEVMFCQRYGLDGWGPPKTLEEVGDLHNLTRERVRQLNAIVFHKARTSWAKKLEGPALIESEEQLIWVIEQIIHAGEMLAVLDGALPLDYGIVSAKPERERKMVAAPTPKRRGRKSKILINGVRTRTAMRLIPHLVETLVQPKGIEPEELLTSPDYSEHRQALVRCLTLDLGEPLATFVEIFPGDELEVFQSLTDPTTKIDGVVQELIEALRANYSITMWSTVLELWERQNAVLHGKQQDELRAWRDKTKLKVRSVKEAVETAAMPDPDRHAFLAFHHMNGETDLSSDDGRSIARELGIKQRELPFRLKQVWSVLPPDRLSGYTLSRFQAEKEDLIFADLLLGE